MIKTQNLQLQPQEFLPAWEEGCYIDRQAIFSFDGVKGSIELDGDSFPVSSMPRPELVALGWKWGFLQHLFVCEKDLQRFVAKASALGTRYAARDKYNYPMVLPDENPDKVLPQFQDKFEIVNPGSGCGESGTDTWDTWAVDCFPQDCVNWNWDGDWKIVRFRKKGWGYFRSLHCSASGERWENTKILSVGVALSPEEIWQIWQVPLIEGRTTVADMFPECKNCIYFFGQVMRGETLVCSLHPQGVRRKCLDREIQKPILRT